MPDITQRIADILKHHRFERCSESRSGYFAWWGRCSGCEVESQRRHIADGWEIDMQADESAHVAEVLTNELGLRQEHRMEWTDSLGVVRATAPAASKAVAKRYVSEAHQHQPDTDARAAYRYVTGWVPDE